MPFAILALINGQHSRMLCWAALLVLRRRTTMMPRVCLKSFCWGCGGRSPA